MSGVSSNLRAQVEIPDNELERLAAIEKYRILDTEQEKDFDDLVQLAAQVCDAPVGIITLIDEKRQWFKAKIGWGYLELDRKVAFCAHTILQNDIMMVPDATKDQRFCENPLVTADPQIRFYAGVPLVTPDGYKLGTLAVVDFKPRSLTDPQILALRILTRQVGTLLELRLNNIKLKESNAKNAYLANLLEHTDEAFYSTDKKGIITSWNAAAEKLFGVKREDAIGRHNLEPTGDKVSDEYRALVYQQLMKQGFWREERELVTKAGQRHFVQYNVNLIKDESGEMDGVVIAVKDITQKKDLEIELQKTNENLQKIVDEQTAEIKNVFERVSDGFVAIDKAGICTYANRRAAQIVDVEPGYLIGKYIWNEFHASVGEAFQNVVKVAMETQQHQSMEVYYEEYDRWFENHIYPSPTGMSIYFRDITKRKVAENKLKAQFDELQKKNYELDRFAYSVSHDLRAPLASVLGLIHIAEMEPLTPTLQKYLELMRCSVNRLDDFIREILDYARNARTELATERVNFKLLMKSTLTKLENLSGSSRLKVELNVEDDGDFHSDSHRLSIVLNHILTNAILFQDYNKPVSFITIDIKAAHDACTIRIRDNGVGIEAKYIGEVFNMFYKGTATSTGSGLGLYIVKEIISKLWGTISVSSQHGEWTAFEIQLPNLKPPKR